ncbi:MAG TPA: hypothetical protein VFA41_15675 [Ktedonobacteraceae bacterium]|jgi:hypothetical protein|nr:hypothetical protein [Ktedonobacteraceae bacterium]
MLKLYFNKNKLTMNWLLDIKERKEVKNMCWTTPEDDDGGETAQGSSFCPTDTDDDGLEENEDDDSDEGEGDGEDKVFPPTPEDGDEDEPPKSPPDPPPQKPDSKS